ncbi:MAG: hypothetical protein IPG74_05345 [Flavobacteriales bacterium]|nr:hypothetical protein [Flavobacteriales bacterium]
MFAVSLRAQDTAGVFPVRTIHVNPLSLISPYEPSLRIGYEQFITPRASILIEAGGYPSFNVEGWMDGILGRVEVCYWYRTNKNGKWSGVSLGIAYKAMHGTFQDSIAIGNMPPYMRSYEVEKDVLLVRLLRVDRVVAVRRWRLESYYGIGVRIRNAVAYGITEEELEHRRYSDCDECDTPEVVRSIGRQVLPGLVAGFRVGLDLYEAPLSGRAQHTSGCRREHSQ